MKKILACFLAALLIVALLPVVSAGAADETVYVSVSVDGKLELAAKPVSVGEPTVDNVLKAAHEAYYSGGLEGYASGIDSTWNMFMISRAWGVDGTPYVMVNGEPIGADPNNPAAADTYPVKTGDNIIVAVSTDPMVAAQAVSMAAVAENGEATVSAKLWTLNFTTFQYTSMPLAGAKIVNPETGEELGELDSSGIITIPATGIAAVDGLAAIPVDGSSNSTKLNEVKAPVEELGDGEGTMVYVTVSVNGELKVAAQPVRVAQPTVEAALIKTHQKYYPGGESGFHAGINQQYFMYMIDTFWGVAATPYVLLNGAPLGTDITIPSTADAAPVAEGDKIIVNICSMGTTVPVVSLTQNDKGYIVATEWMLDVTTFQYDSTSLSNAEIIDAETGKVLGVTDGTGKVKVDVPECGVVAIKGLSAVPVGEVKEFTPVSEAYVPPARDYSVFGGKDGKQLLLILVLGLAAAVPLGITIFIGQRRELKRGGVKEDI